MKKILGSLLFLSLSLFGRSEYTWDVQLQNKNLYLHQATVLTMQCKFEKEGKNDDVEFEPPLNIPFDFKLLSEKRHFEGELQTLTFKYLLFAKEAGKYEIKLKPVMLFTSQSAIDNVIVGRDNVNDLEVDRQEVQMKAISVEVHDTQAPLTGLLSLENNLDLHNVSAYEPVHLEISIIGEGNLHALKPFNFEIEGVEVFSDKVETNFVLEEKGYKGKWLQRFAFVGKKDFIIPSLSVEYFDVNDKKIKVLKTQGFEIKINNEGIQRQELLDAVNLPTSKIDFSQYIDYVYYFLTFLAGFIVAKLVKLPKKKSTAFKKGEKIKKTKSEKELLEVLLLCDKELFGEEIETLEKAVYKGQGLSLSKLKKSALSRL